MISYSYPFTVLLSVGTPVICAEDITTIRVEVDETVSPAARPAKAACLALGELGADIHNGSASIAYLAGLYPVLAVFEGSLEPESLEQDFWKGDGEREDEE